MNYKVYTINEIKKRFEEVTKKYVIDEAYLFGSYARGDATPESDVDFYIKADNLKSGWDVGGIWAETEKAMDKKIDVVYTDAIMEKEFELEMKKNLVKIYG
ncbi:MAG: nucleotidyltransferase domain-containing protein [Chitinispirillales bacterium]|jgi:predicted nucleotidyltransferase|nr:nucleotidyltransferase domain-containing protein [Chitinispirillales bacterium]